MVVGGLCAVLGLVLGPFLAGLTLSVPAASPVSAGEPGPAGEPGWADDRVSAGGPGEPVLGPRWWRGAAASGGRIALVTALAVVALGAVGGAVGAEPQLPAYLWLAAVAVTLAVIDWETLRLPDRLTLPSYPVGLVLLAIPADWPALGRGVLGALVAGGAALLLAIVAPGGGLGFGDVKLLGLLGLFLGWLGWGVLVLGVAIGFVLGALVAVGLLASRRAGLRDHLAFGPWLIAGALVAVVAGRPLVDAWLGTGP